MYASDGITTIMVSHNQLETFAMADFVGEGVFIQGRVVDSREVSTEIGLRLLSLVPSHHDHPLNEPLGIRPEVKHLVVFPRQ